MNCRFLFIVLFRLNLHSGHYVFIIDKNYRRGIDICDLNRFVNQQIQFMVAMLFFWSFLNRHITPGVPDIIRVKHLLYLPLPVESGWLGKSGECFLKFIFG